MILTCDNGLVSAIFLRNLRVQNTKPVRPLRNLYDTTDQCDIVAMDIYGCGAEGISLWELEERNIYSEITI